MHIQLSWTRRPAATALRFPLPINPVSRRGREGEGEEREMKEREREI
jgi:hypothetical protein